MIKGIELCLNDNSNQSDLPREITEDPGTLPGNIYNKGFAANIADILFPPCVPLLINLDLKKDNEVDKKNDDDDYEIIDKDD